MYVVLVPLMRSFSIYMFNLYSWNLTVPVANIYVGSIVSHLIFGKILQAGVGQGKRKK